MDKDSRLFVGMDVGDRRVEVHILDEQGAVVEESRLATTGPALRRKFARMEPCRVALEVGSHSHWISRTLRELGHEVVVADPRRLRLIYANPRKNDRVDAQYLARLARLDPQLLFPVHHRNAQAQADLAVLRSRDGLVRARTQLVNHARGMVKSFGARLPSCSAESFSSRAGPDLPAALVPALQPVLENIAALTAQIRGYDRQLRQMAAERYPETTGLRRIPGVGPLTSLAFVLTLEDPRRFRKSREVGAYLGLVPRQRQSSQRDPQLRISKTGDAYLRRLLVGCAHYLLGPFGPACDLRGWGLRHSEGGGPNARKRAIVAVARKLAVLLHHLWLTGESYQAARA